MSRTITIEGLLQTIQQLELASEARLLELARVADECTTLQMFAQYTYDQNDLTPFQLETILNGNADKLVLRQYILRDQLGEGGMGQVYRAWHRLLNRDVAIKIVRKELVIHSHIIDRFRQEARLAAQCSHLNLVAIHDADVEDHNHYLVMEYIAGDDLHRLVQRDGPLSVPLACEYIQQAALGLQHAHKLGMVHRDVKPANLLVANGIVKVADLGLARLYGTVERNDLTGPGILLGSPDFLAPEQADDPKSATHLSDIYSLGYTLYFLLAGRLPYPGGSAYEKILRHRAELPAPVSRFRTDVPPALESLIQAMTAKSPANRPANLAEIARQLLLHTPPHVGGAATELSLRSPPSQPQTITANRFPIRSWLLGSCLTMLVVGIICGAYLWMPEKEKTTLPTVQPEVIQSKQQIGEPLHAADFHVTQRWELNGVGNQLAVSPNGRMVACLVNTKTQTQLQLFSFENEVPLVQFDLPSRGYSLAFSPNGQVVAIGMEAKNGQASIWIWDVETQATKYKRILPSSIRSLIFWSAETLMTATDDGMLQRWAMTSNGPDLQATWSAHNGAVQSMVIDREHEMLITATTQTIKFWPKADLEGMAHTELTDGETLKQFHLGRDGHELLGIAVRDGISIPWAWDRHTNRAGSPFSAIVNGTSIDALAISADRRTLAIAGRANLGVCQVHLWDLHDHEWHGHLQSETTNLEVTTWSRINTLGFVFDGHTIVTCGTELIVWRQN